jgi:hypothetical protein
MVPPFPVDSFVPATMMRHDPGLAASPLARYILDMGGGKILPFRFSAFDGQPFTKQRCGAPWQTQARFLRPIQFDPVPDDVWDEATRHFNERELANLTLCIALTNVWNRLNITTRQVAGEWIKSSAAKEWTPSHAMAQ